MHFPHTNATQAGAATPAPQDMQPPVSGYRHTNWRMDGPPPLIINPQADLHTLLAWAWGEAKDLETLHFMHTSDEEATAAELVAAGLNRLVGLTAMLQHLAAHTLSAHKGAVSLQAQEVTA